MRIRSNFVGIGAGLVLSLFLLAIGLGLYLAVSVRSLASKTEVLLVSGKTAAAESSAHTEAIAEQIKTLIQNGNAAAAKASKFVAEAEMPIISEIAEGHVTGNQNQALLCSIATSIGDRSTAVITYCKG